MQENTSRPFTAASFNKFLQEQKLMASRCSRCSSLFLPPRAICPHCQGREMTWAELSGRGKLAAFTSIYIGPSWMNSLGFGRQRPYLSGVVELEEGVKISARILGLEAGQPEKIRIGLPLSVAFEEQVSGETKKTVLAFTA